MKPEPYHALPPRELDENESVILRMAASSASGPIRLQGTIWFAAARRLAKMELGEVNGRTFIANARGIAAVKGKA